MPYRQSLTAISLFSGGGGFDLGISLAGFETRAAVEWEKYACKTLRRNQGKLLPFTGRRHLDRCAIIEKDIRTLRGQDILESTKMRAKGVSLLIGGPPCISFSSAGRRDGLLSESGRLFKEYVRILEVIQPRAFIFENVRGLLVAPGFEGSSRTAFETILDELSIAGYKITWKLINAADYGIPQHRHRVFIIGNRGNKPIEFPLPTHVDPSKEVRAPKLRQWKTVRDAIGNLPVPVPVGGLPIIPNHIARRCSPHIAESFSRTLPGMRNPIYRRDRLLWDAPAKTIRAQGKPKLDGSNQKHGSHQPIHPEQHRQITVREAARLQTFPDWYEFDETLVNAYRVIGDAVPPLLAKVLAASIRKQLFGL